MVVVYRMGKLSFALVMRLVKIAHISKLPNLLAGKGAGAGAQAVTLRTSKLSRAAAQSAGQSARPLNRRRSFLGIHQQLRRDASATAARRRCYA